MRRFSGMILALTLVGIAYGDVTPNVNVRKYTGTFLWLKLGVLPPAYAKTMANAKTITFDVTFPQDVKLKKDAKGNQWFTFIAADQGADGKWNQTSGYGALKQLGGTIKAGTYTVSVSVKGLSKTVLQDKQQTISLGAGTSGLVGLISFKIDNFKGR